jgi:hypothetical protein
MGYRARWYADEDNLRHIGRQHLEQLLGRYAKELSEAGIRPPPKDADDDACYRLLANVFMRPEGIPDKLHDALEAKLYGIEEIRLRELQQVVDEETNDVRIRRADDVFDAYDAEDGLPQEPIRKAVFGVLMRKGGAYQRKVTVEEGNVAKYTQGADGRHVTAWLDGQGFTVGGPLTEEDASKEE